MNAEKTLPPLSICHVITRLIIGGARNIAFTCRGHEKGHA